MSTTTPMQQHDGDTEKERPPKRMTVPDFIRAKHRGMRLTVLTAYDYTFARILDRAGVDCILVGDSLGMVVQGRENCLGVTLDEVIYHTQCVARGVERSLLVADMPFMSFQLSPEQALENAGRIVKEAGAHAVKIEGGVRSADRIAAITSADIPVMAHIGLTPQSVHRMGGFRVQRDEDLLLADAAAVAEAGAFAVVIECVPAPLARRVRASLQIPTIGIGAGDGCDGQVLVLHDLLGMYEDLRPRFVKRYGDIGQDVLAAVQQYCREVREGLFPTAEHSFE
jgi:3-methyl-2-oxobutanoate hydroxymethyltransferase